MWPLLKGTKHKHMTGWVRSSSVFAKLRQLGKFARTTDLLNGAIVNPLPRLGPRSLLEDILRNLKKCSSRFFHMITSISFDSDLMKNCWSALFSQHRDTPGRYSRLIFQIKLYLRMVLCIDAINFKFNILTLQQLLDKK